jgi:fimbrial isopeptide formation D2 family protein
LTFDNAGGKVPAAVNYTDDLSKTLDDATVSSAPALASGSGLTVGSVSGAGTFTITGTVAAGQSATVTYQVRVKSPDTGDHQLDNYLVPTGTTPPPSCLASNPDCTTNPVTDLVVTKSVNPASTTPVLPGQTLNYTLSFDNSLGKAPASVNYTDDLSKTLDDATVTTPPASRSGLTVSSVSGAGTFTITGTVAAGASATVTYQVRVNSPDLGDHRLDNYLVPTGTTPPPACLVSDPDCTTNPVHIPPGRGPSSDNDGELAQTGLDVNPFTASGIAAGLLLAGALLVVVATRSGRRRRHG